MKILICDKLDKQTLEELQKIGNCIDASEEKNKKEKIIENIVDAEIVLVRSDTHINKELIDIKNSKMQIKNIPDVPNNKSVKSIEVIIRITDEEGCDKTSGQ